MAYQATDRHRRPSNRIPLIARFTVEAMVDIEQPKKKAAGIPAVVSSFEVDGAVFMLSAGN